YHTHQNPDVHFAKSIVTAMNQRLDDRLKYAANVKALGQLGALTSEERELRKRLGESQLRAAGVDETLLSTVREQRRKRADQISKQFAPSAPLPHHPPRLDPLGPQSALGELWWTQTS